MRAFGSVVAVMWILSGCGVGGPAQVSLSARVGAPTATAQQPLKQGLTLDDGVTIDRIRVLVKELELQSAVATTSADAGDDDGRGAELEKGPFLIDLSGSALDGSVVQLLATEIPAGTYREVEFKIAPAGDDASGPEFADLRQANASILVDGTIDGAAFTFATGLIAEQEYEGALSVTAGANNITLNIDPSAWFRDGTGARIDPRDAGLKTAIEANIRSSISAYSDDDHDGAYDDDGPNHDLGDDHGGSGELGDDHGGGSDDDGPGHD